MITDKLLVDTIRLIRTNNIGNITFIKLIKEFGDASKVLEYLPDILKNSNTNTTIYEKNKALAEIEKAKNSNIEIVSYLDESYPTLLKETEDFPPILFVKGNKSLLTKTAFAIVGSRNSSIKGRQVAQDFAKQLGNYGYCIVSGMALGIDGAAHKGSLDKGTIAVLGGGVDNIYPKENTSIYEEVAEKGAIISEFQIGTKPIPRHFPKRNRIISGISRGVLVVESSARSGSLITAKCALEQGREVFAIPGSPSDPKSKGCNNLIKDGAYLVENVEDIIKYLPQKHISNLKEDTRYFSFKDFPKLNKDKIAETKELLINNLNESPIEIDIILQELKLNYNYLTIALFELELAGKIERLPGNKICLINKE